MPGSFCAKGRSSEVCLGSPGGVKLGRPMVEGELAAEAGIGEICVVRASVIRGTQRKGEPKISAPKSVGK